MVKNRCNAKAYDPLPIRVPKSRRQAVEARAQQVRESVNGYVNGLIRADLRLSGDEWKQPGEGVEEHEPV